MKIKKMLKSQYGFTLVEMLIVVAIIAILIAVSIPFVNKNLEKSRNATDNANVRSAKAAAMIDFMSDDDSGVIATTGGTAYYNAASGNLEASNTTAIKGYGKSTSSYVPEGSTLDTITKVQGAILKVVVDADGVATLTWVAAAAK